MRTSGGESYPRAEDRKTRLAVCLHRRLDRVNRGEDHTEASSREGREDGLSEGRKVLQIFVGLQEREDADVRSRVAKPGDGALDEGRGETLVVPCPAAVRVERDGRL